MSNVFFNGHTAVDVVDPSGVGGYSRKSKAELERQYGKLEIISIAEAVERIEQRACTLPIEVTEAEWDEALNVLPPLKWIRTADVESFRICEPTVATVHATYVRLGKRYFCMNRPRAESHEQVVSLAATVMAAPRTHH